MFAYRIWDAFQAFIWRDLHCTLLTPLAVDLNSI